MCDILWDEAFCWDLMTCAYIEQIVEVMPVCTFENIIPGISLFQSSSSRRVKILLYLVESLAL